MKDRTRVTTLPEDTILHTQRKLAEDGIELTFEEVDQRFRNAIDGVRRAMLKQGFDFPNDDYNAMKLMKLIMMGE